MGDTEVIDAKEQLIRQTLETFVKGLIEQIRTHVKSRNPPTLEVAKSIVKTEELDIQSERDTMKRYNNNNNENFRNNTGNNMGIGIAILIVRFIQIILEDLIARVILIITDTLTIIMRIEEIIHE